MFTIAVVSRAQRLTQKQSLRGPSAQRWENARWLQYGRSVRITLATVPATICSAPSSWPTSTAHSDVLQASESVNPCSSRMLAISPRSRTWNLPVRTSSRRRRSVYLISAASIRSPVRSSTPSVGSRCACISVESATAAMGISTVRRI